MSRIPLKSATFSSGNGNINTSALHHSTNVTFSGGSLIEGDGNLFPEYTASVLIWKYCPPVLLALGTVGNAVTIFIYASIEWGSSSHPLFLIALAVVDLCVLYSGLVPDISYHVFELDLRGMNDVACKVLTWLVDASALMSAWLVVAMTMQRAMSVTWPHHVTFLCSRRKAGVTITLVILTAAGFQAHLLYGLQVRDTEAYLDGACAASGDYESFWESVWPWLDIATFSLIPSLLLLVSNAALIHSLRTSFRHVSSIGATNMASSRKKMASSMTYTLITVSVTFLLLITPMEATVIAWWLLRDRTKVDIHLRASLELAWAVGNMLWYTNSAVNFLLYCLSGSSFRQQFVQCFKCKKRNSSAAALSSSS